MLINHTLDNGLKIHLEHKPDVQSVAVGILVRTGSRDEPLELTGISHFLEHLCFKGTRQRTTEELNQAVDSLGAQWNGFTWWEGTSYYLWVPSEYISSAVEILADMLRPSLKASDFHLEKQIILEEIAMYEDSPDESMIDELFQIAFRDQPLGQRVLGTSQSVERLRLTDLKSYYRECYSPNRLEFVVVGHFNPENVFNIIKKQCGRWKGNNQLPKRATPSFHKVNIDQHCPELSRTHLAIGIPAPPRSHLLAPTAEALAGYLGDDENSRFFWAIKQKGLAEEISVIYEGLSDIGMIIITACIDPRNRNKVEQLIKSELDQVHSKFDPSQFQRSQNRLITEIVYEAENGLDRLEHLVDLLATNCPLKTLDEELKAIETVTPENVAKYLKCYPLNTGFARVALGKMQ